MRLLHVFLKTNKDWVLHVWINRLKIPMNVLVTQNIHEDFFKQINSVISSFQLLKTKTKFFHNTTLN